MTGLQLKAGVVALALAGAVVYAVHDDGTGVADGVGTWGLTGGRTIALDGKLKPFACVDMRHPSWEAAYREVNLKPLTWMGRCAKGVPDGEGVIVSVDSGSTYEGSFVDGKQDGHWLTRPKGTVRYMMGVPKGTTIDVCYRAGERIDCE